MFSGGHLPAIGLVLLAGCASGVHSVDDIDAAIGKMLVQGNIVATKDGAAAPTTVALDRGFRDALLGSVLANEGYLSAQASEAAALAEIGVAQSGRRTQFGADMTLGGIREGNPVSDTTLGGSGDVTMSRLIYDGGASTGGINRATATALAAQANRLDRGNLIAIEAARAWVDLWQASERLSLLHRKTGNFVELIKQMDRMVSNGMIDRATAENARRQLLDIKLEQTALEAEKAEAAVRFELHFRQVPDKITRPTEIVTLSMVTARADGWKNAPALKQVAAEVFVAKGALQEAQAAFRPRVSLQAGATSPMDKQDTTDVSAGLQLQYVFNDGGRRKAQLEAAEKRVLALEAQFAEARRAAQADLEGAMVRLKALEKSVALVSQKVDLSASEADVARSQIATEQAGLRQLISAEIENYRASDQKIQMQAERLVLLMTIAGHTGYLTEVIGLAS